MIKIIWHKTIIWHKQGYERKVLWDSWSLLIISNLVLFYGCLSSSFCNQLYFILFYGCISSLFSDQYFLLHSMFAFPDHLVTNLMLNSDSWKRGAFITGRNKFPSCPQTIWIEFTQRKRKSPCLSTVRD